jgi:hypothetical protein
MVRCNAPPKYLRLLIHFLNISCTTKQMSRDSKMLTVSRAGYVATEVCDLLDVALRTNGAYASHLAIHVPGCIIYSRAGHLASYDPPVLC